MNLLRGYIILKISKRVIVPVYYFFFHKICHDDAKEILLGIQSDKSQVYPRKSACMIFSEELLIFAVEKLKNSRPFWSNQSFHFGDDISAFFLKSKFSPPQSRLQPPPGLLLFAMVEVFYNMIRIVLTGCREN